METTSEDLRKTVELAELETGKKGLISKLFRFKLHLIVLCSFTILGSGYQKSISYYKINKTEEHIGLFKEALQNHLNIENSIVEISGIELCSTPLIRKLYAAREYNPYWTSNFQVNDHALICRDLCKNAMSYGLNPSDYNVSRLVELEEILREETKFILLEKARIDYELLLTNSVFKFLLHLSKGTQYEDTLNYQNPNNWYLNSLPRYLMLAENAGDFKFFLLDVQPSLVQYRRLQSALEQYVAKVEINEKSFTLPEEINESSILIINKRLDHLGFGNGVKTGLLDTLAIKKFQVSHGIKADGILDKKTLKALSKSNYELFLQVAINLERYRSDVLYTRNYTWVNIPSFSMKIIEDNKEVASFRTIIGSPSTPTPQLSSWIEKVVTFPSWNVPHSISSREILRKVKRDSLYLKRNNYTVFDENKQIVNISDVNWKSLSANDFNYRFIQSSSRSNALGIIKFLFPNKYSVYVHDTPGRHLFNNSYRALSHGCVRLENPDKFAAYLLEKEGEEYKERLEYNLTKGKQEIFLITKPWEIHLRYYTCEADEAGNLYFLEDIYKLDEPLISLFREDFSCKEQG